MESIQNAAPLKQEAEQPKKMDMRQSLDELTELAKIAPAGISEAMLEQLGHTRDALDRRLDLGFLQLCKPKAEDLKYQNQPLVLIKTAFKRLNKSKVYFHHPENVFAALAKIHGIEPAAMIWTPVWKQWHHIVYALAYMNLTKHGHQLACQMQVLVEVGFSNDESAKETARQELQRVWVV